MYNIVKNIENNIQKNNIKEHDAIPTDVYYKKTRIIMQILMHCIKYCTNIAFSNSMDNSSPSFNSVKEGRLLKTKCNHYKYSYCSVVLQLFLNFIKLKQVNKMPENRRSKKYKVDIDKHIWGLATKYYHLQTKYYHLQTKYYHLQTKYYHLQTKYYHLKTKYYHLQTKYYNLQTKYYHLQTKYYHLQTKFYHLQTKYYHPHNRHCTCNAERHAETIHFCETKRLKAYCLYTKDSI